MKLPFTLSLIVVSFVGLGQNGGGDTRALFKYQIKKATQPIVLDGAIGIEEWGQHLPITNFFNHWPSDVGQAQNQTEVKLTYDDQNLYLLAKCYDKESRIIQSLVRDSDDDYWGSDNFSFVLDPVNTKQSGFFFGVTAGGAETEGNLTIEGSQTWLSENWDNKWASKTAQYEEYWLVEMAIPFKTLRYNANQTTWGINFIRGDKQNNEYTTWTQFPVNFNGVSLNYMGSMEWDKSPEKAKGAFILNPYVTSSSVRDFEDENQSEAELNSDLGGEVKIALTSSLNLDLTLFPDFSNADVDQQVTNITRFNIFLPEQRNFFLENNDIFSSFGTYDIKPFFSRRIGINDGDAVPIDFGGRLTGNISPTLRVGVMNVQTRQTDEFAAQNYSVGAFQQRVLKRSVVKGLFINRQATSNTEELEYSRNAGLEFSYISDSGRLNTTFMYHTSLTPENYKDTHFYGLEGSYTSKRIRTGWTFNVVGDNYITELGINPRLENTNAETEETVRLGYTYINQWFRYITFVEDENKKLNSHGLRTWYNLYLNPDGTLNETQNNLGYDFQFRNTARMIWLTRYRKVNLLFPTSLIGDDFTPIPIADYSFLWSELYYDSDERKTFVWNTSLAYGQFFNGTRLGAMVQGSFRLRPWGSFGLTYDFNDIQLAEGFGKDKIHLVRFNGDISFSNKLFMRNVLQYNTQGDNFSAFSRLQWRYSPMSDIFLIFNENHDTQGLGIKNRSLVLKVTYWL
ncbi:DUF5916 domain-containing protein [Flagellimonas flava]|uniref:Carbohydrate family 9 binding domain-like n=1 Tax=Flagellimonas flava TaxID=570519 RepID=A0A1M5N9A1_9FLAO|nr:DUF5916 domain-containing protein [Allomuricauda flava]SHG86166.1 Carbohydrate family 9 binding domain-like [Allomuricauda flava]